MIEIEGQEQRKKSIISFIKAGIIGLAIVVFVTFLFTGELKSFCSWGILALLAVLRFIVPDTIIYFREKKKN